MDKVKVNESSKPNTNNQILNKIGCKVCGDEASGNYYGVLACHGCKSFFRRAVLGNVHKCRYNGNCTIEEDLRTQCRHCRLRKCLKAGMRTKAIKSDRGPHKYRGCDEETSNTSTMTSLLIADELMKKPTNLSLGMKLLTGEESMSGRKVATLKEYLSAMKGCLLHMVTWAKSVQPFCELLQEDKVALLRAHAGEYTIYTLTRRSLHLTDFLVMCNGFLLTRVEGGVMGVTGRIIDELVLPFRKLNMDDTEFALLKGILFFDPGAPGLIERKRIEKLRLEAQSSLEEYIRDRQLESSGRFGSMLLRLLSLQSIANAMNKEMQYRKLFGIAPIDKLLRQMLLGEAIRTDRNTIWYRKPLEGNPNALTLTTLIRADELVKEPSRLTLGIKILDSDDWMGDVKIPTLMDNLSSLKEQLQVMVTWAKSIPAFCDLSLEDKVVLLQAHSGEYVVLGIARRSLPLNDALLFGNGGLITRESKDVSSVTPRILDELVLPFRALNMDDAEFALLKAILFFDPSPRGLSERGRIEALRKQAQVLLEEHVRDRQLESPGRLSDILLRLLNIQTISVAISDKLEMKRLFGIARIDMLLRQMVLREDVESDSTSDSGIHEDSPSPVQPPECVLPHRIR